MKVLIAYFSGTGNTAAVAEQLEKALTGAGVQVDKQDLTPLKDRQKPLAFDNYDALMFGNPIYVNRAPAVIRQWLTTQDGKGKKCATFFTYGGVMPHPAHRSTREILEAQNFVVVSSAEFVGRHTFNRAGWEAAPGRPDESDFELAREFALKTLKRFSGEDAGVPGEFPAGQAYEALDQMEKGMKMGIPQFPSRMGVQCSMCMDCEDQCSTGAMDAESGNADKEKCILCLRCVEVCPEKVIKLGDLGPMFKMVLERTKQTRESIAEKKSKLYF